MVQPKAPVTQVGSIAKYKQYKYLCTTMSTNRKQCAELFHLTLRHVFCLIGQPVPRFLKWLRQQKVQRPNCRCDPGTESIQNLPGSWLACIRLYTKDFRSCLLMLVANRTGGFHCCSFQIGCTLVYSLTTLCLGFVSLGEVIFKSIDHSTR